MSKMEKGSKLSMDSGKRAGRSHRRHEKDTRSGPGALFFVGMAVTVISSMFALLGVFRLLRVRSVNNFFLMDFIDDLIPYFPSICCGLTMLFVALIFVGIFLGIYSIKK